MNIKTIVFDFDKTLTHKDTLFDFFTFVSKKNIFFPLKVFIYFFAMFLHKIKFIRNTSLKKFGIYLFIDGLEKSLFKHKCQKFSETIILNKLFASIKNINEANIYIVSASFENYIKYLFPQPVKIVSSKISSISDNKYVLERNAFSSKKVIYLKEEGINFIDQLYTDSLDDLPLAKISSEIYHVRGDMIKKYTYNEFKKLK